MSIATLLFAQNDGDDYPSNVTIKQSTATTTTTQQQTLSFPKSNSS